MEQTFNKIIDLIYLAKKDGVEFILNGEKLQLKVADSKTIDKDLLEDIRNNKHLIIDFLNNDEWKSKNVNGTKSKIKPFDREIVKTIPLSFSQERLMFIDQLDHNASSLYHGLVVLRLKGILSKDALSFAIKNLIERHQVLRTIYKIENGFTYQQVISSDNWQLSEIEVSNNEVKDLVDKLSAHPFNLTSDYMLRASLLRVGEEEHVLVVVMHHIASDAWSIPIIVREVVELYSSYTEDRQPSLGDLPLQYADYALWQRDYLKGSVLEEKLQYWKDKLSGVSPLLLPTDHARPAVRGSRGGSVFSTIDKETTTAINGLSRREGASLYMVLLAAFKVLLHRYSRQQDISVGTSIANRNQQEIEGLVGFFVNTLTLRTQVNPSETFTRLLDHVKHTTLGAYEHQDVPFEKIVETVLKERDASRSPLFQVMLVLLNTPESPRLQLGQLELSAEPLENTSAKFEITFFVTESSHGLRISAEYSTDLYNKETIQNMLGQYAVLLKAVTEQPTQKIGMLPLLSSQERQYMLQLGRNTTPYDADANVVDLFETQVQQQTGQAAVVYEGQHLSYGQLNEQANQLAHYLRSKGVQKGDLVPLCIEKGMDMLVGILGILKAGAAYVPVDTAFPAERISWMLEDIRPKVAVTNSESRYKIETASEEDIHLAEIDDEMMVGLQPKHNPQAIEGSSHTAYVIYTSGSTGKPKGVLIAHRALGDYVAGLSQKLPIDQCGSYALVSTIATDLGNTVIYSSLLKGGTLHLFSKAQVSNIDYLHAYFNKNDIDCLKIVPGHWKALHLDGAALLPNKMLIFGGEALAAGIVAEIGQQAPGCMVVNHYGPTETTIGKLLHIAETQKNKYGATIPIGKPFGNTRVYVLSDQQQVNPTGVPGQLYIAGHGLAKGYYHNAELTNEKFVPDLLRKGESEIGEIEEKEGEDNNEEQNGEERMYATGDLVRYLADGNIVFIGRVDEQVKIRGYRVELGEIENTIKQYEGISQAVVIAPDDKQGNRRVVAYVVADGGFSKEMLNSYLKEKLPDYMLPAVVIQLESVPLTANGKVDKRSLPDADVHDQPQKGYVAPESEAQQQMADIWQDILEVEQVGIHDDFFELGGHSLLAVRLISAIRKEFTVELPISHVFDYPTVALLAEQLPQQSATSTLHFVNTQQNKSLIPIKTGGNKFPLYIVCGTGGTAFAFKKFANMLDPKQPVYGLQQTNLKEGLEEFPDTIEGIASKYVNEILIQNPLGPYALSGHCVGGIIAFEMAKQLKSMGRNVHMLAMLDTLVRSRKKLPPATYKNFYQIPAYIKKTLSAISFKIEFETFLLRKHPRKAIGYKVAKLESLINKKIKSKYVKEENAALKVFDELSDVYRTALSKYRLKHYEGDILAFYAKEHYYFLDKINNVWFKKFLLEDSDKNFWKQYANNTTVYEIDGEHSLIFDPKNAKEFAHILQDHLNRKTTE